MKKEGEKHAGKEERDNFVSDLSTRSEFEMIPSDKQALLSHRKGRRKRKEKEEGGGGRRRRRRRMKDGVKQSVKEKKGERRGGIRRPESNRVRKTRRMRDRRRKTGRKRDRTFSNLIPISTGIIFFWLLFLLY